MTSLRAMFTEISCKYDLFNKTLTFGLDKVWREKCARECAMGKVVLDLCCGTGDLSLDIVKHLSSEASVIGLDFTRNMLDRAIQKRDSKERKLSSNLDFAESRTKPAPTFILADAAHLPFKDNSFNAIGISFSFRNLIYRHHNAAAHLTEINRALQHGGTFACIETSQPKCSFLQRLFRLYCTRIVPLLGWLISKKKYAYRYLGLSAANFATAENLTVILSRFGFRNVAFRRFACGAIALHRATR